jgi:hypothetical protein
MRSSYGKHYRRMVPKLLKTLEFSSNNNAHKPVIHALDIIRKYSHTNIRYFPNSEYMPFDGIIRPKMRETVKVKITDKAMLHLHFVIY